ncbi:MAG: hypothetical protein CYG60_19040 [Actinobacteria bacterium]|nr:MAG: hypothetical protein CYG60_19040 [Actinomycetota bacterium]
MALPELLREIEDRGVTLMAAPVEPRLRFRPASRLTPELVEGLRTHKAAILEALEGRVTSDRSEISKPHHEALIRNTGEVLELARAHFGEIAPEHRQDAPYPPSEKGTDPLVHRHTAKARFFRDVKRRDRERRERDGLPPWIRQVDGGGDAA